MTERLLRSIALIVASLTFASCSSDTTAPETPEIPESPSASEPSLAAATSENIWIKRADMPSVERWALALAMVPNASGQSVVYAIGGTSRHGSLSKVQAYNVATNTWSYKASMPIPLFATNGAGVIGGKIYLSGGVSGSKSFHDDLLMYDPAANRWTRKSYMPNTSVGGVTGVINDKLYVATSCHHEDCAPNSESSALYRYDPATDTWDRLATPPHSPRYSMAGVIGGKFYVVSSGNLDVYDPTTNTWTSRASMPSPRWAAGGSALGAKLYVIGGYRVNPDGRINEVRSVAVYDRSTNTWTNQKPLPTARSYVPAIRVLFKGRGRVEVIGGSRPGNNLQYIP
jgi:N-acetylneuraminic acid mutarotase